MIRIPIGAIEFAKCDFLFDHPYPNVLSTILNASGIKAEQDSWEGTGYIGNNARDRKELTRYEYF